MFPAEQPLSRPAGVGSRRPVSSLMRPRLARSRWFRRRPSTSPPVRPIGPSPPLLHPGAVETRPKALRDHPVPDPPERTKKPAGGTTGRTINDTSDTGSAGAGREEACERHALVILAGFDRLVAAACFRSDLDPNRGSEHRDARTLPNERSLVNPRPPTWDRFDRRRPREKRSPATAPVPDRSGTGRTTPDE